jgi:hypothetical protein
MTFLKTGLVFFGGGFVLIPVLHHRLVTELGWLSPREFLDGVAISNLTPGPIAVLATFAGYHVAPVRWLQRRHCWLRRWASCGCLAGNMSAIEAILVQSGFWRE